MIDLDKILTLQNIGRILIVCAPFIIFGLLLYGIAVVGERIAEAIKKMAEALTKLVIAFAAILILIYGIYLATGGKTPKAQVRFEGKSIVTQVEEGK